MKIQNFAKINFYSNSWSAISLFTIFAFDYKGYLLLVACSDHEQYHPKLDLHCLLTFSYDYSLYYYHDIHLMFQFFVCSFPASNLFCMSPVFVSMVCFVWLHCGQLKSQWNHYVSLYRGEREFLNFLHVEERRKKQIRLEDASLLSDKNSKMHVPQWLAILARDSKINIFRID